MITLLRTFKMLCLGAALAGLVGCASTETRETTGQYVDDSVVTAKVKAALYDDTGLKAQDIKVNTYRGIVQLSGFVDSRDTRSRAEDAASRVEGVSEVKNNLIVK
ncbi:BON domain-containing protein [Geomesophilobacter sediminis]|uniref:Osmotically-inducible protein Y n=1 Tax=Geomesophilobacter sediminis TaxID=2798584 RepID=A0A8J7J4N2_9BACT|nr:BON domain-containing protein [Geomesophilobacter sediminis]MBJ6725878.1 BON domain-containing protein [Geomesophilobacter sediminis]